MKFVSLIVAVSMILPTLCISRPVFAAEKKSKSFNVDGIIYERIDAEGYDVRVIGIDEEAFTVVDETTGADDDHAADDAENSENDENTGNTGNIDAGVILVIPGSINYKDKDYNVTEIGNAAFAFTEIGSVVISEGIVSIGDSAFAGCAAVEEIKLPDSIKNIGNGAFLYCTKLRNIVIDERNENFTFFEGMLYSADKKQVYWASNSVKSKLTLPEGTVKVGSYAFEGNTTVKTVTLPGTVKEICYGAFMDCSSLKSVKIPSSVSKIDGNPFMYCSKLGTIKVSSSNKNFYASGSGLLMNRKKTLLISASAAAGTLVVPSGIKRIAEGAAAGNVSITAIVFNEELKTVDAYAFADCVNLKEVHLTTRKVTFNSASDHLDAGNAQKVNIFKNTDYFINFKVPYSSDANSKGSLEEMIRDNSPKGVIITFR